jgi:hypothetical protein
MRHIDHVELTWRLLGEAFAQLEATLTGLAAAAGKPEKYDPSLTRAFFEIVAGRRREGESWEAFLARNPDLLTHGRELVATRLSESRAG